MRNERLQYSSESTLVAVFHPSFLIPPNKMPLIDLQCHYGVTPASRAVRPPTWADAGRYAEQFGVQALCFSSHEAAVDLVDGHAHLDEAIATDKRFYGWLTLSVHQPPASHELARRYLTKMRWIGARFDQSDNADRVTSAGGREIINGLRRYVKPILLTAGTPETLSAAIATAQEFHTLRFLLAPQDERLTANAVPAIKEILNLSLLPCAAFTERDVIAEAVATVGERRVLWGSDWGRFHPAAAIGMIRDSAITGPQRERIGFRNAQELFPA